MAKVHLILQGKGGVGKSFVAALLAQYKLANGITPVCIDTDPVNQTFAGYKSLDVRELNIMSGDEIDTRLFDNLIEIILPTKTDVIVDNGASSFVPLSHYLLSNEVPELLKANGHDLIIHTVITGGQALLDTLNGFSQLAGQFKDQARFVVWLNPYWGPIEQDGRDFEKMKAYKDHSAAVDSIIKLPVKKAETYGRDLSDALQEKLTFDEAIAKATLTIMSKQRLTIWKKELFGLMATAAAL